MAKPVRLQFEIRWEGGAWRFFAPDGVMLLTHSIKSAVVGSAAHELARSWDRLHVRSELTIKTKAGVICDKRTYGDDPEDIQG